MYLSAPEYFERYPGAIPEVLHVLSNWIHETGDGKKGSFKGWWGLNRQKWGMKHKLFKVRERENA